MMPKVISMSLPVGASLRFIQTLYAVDDSSYVVGSVAPVESVNETAA